MAKAPAETAPAKALARAKPAKSKPAKAGKNGAPTLGLSPVRTLRWSLIAIAPILVLATWCLVRVEGWMPHLHHAFHRGDGLNLVRCLGGAVMVALSLTIILPLGTWIRDYPANRFSQGSKVVWYLPLMISGPMWVGLYLMVLAVCVFGLWAAWVGLDGLGLSERWASLLHRG